MNKSAIFSKAHNLVKKVIKAGDNYAVTFGACLKAIYEGLKMTTKTMAEKLIEAGAKVWEKGEMKRIYLNMDLVKALDLGINFNDKKHKLFFDLTTNQFDGTSGTFIRALNAKI